MIYTSTDCYNNELEKQVVSSASSYTVVRGFLAVASVTLLQACSVDRSHRSLPPGWKEVFFHGHSLLIPKDYYWDQKREKGLGYVLDSEDEDAVLLNLTMDSKNECIAKEVADIKKLYPEAAFEDSKEITLGGSTYTELVYSTGTKFAVDTRPESRKVVDSESPPGRGILLVGNHLCISSTPTESPSLFQVYQKIVMSIRK